MTPLIVSCANDIVVVANKEELKQHWKLICVDKDDKFTKQTSKDILETNIARDKWIGEEKCQTTATSTKK